MTQFLVAVYLLILFPGAAEKQPVEFPVITKLYENKEACVKDTAEKVVEILDKNLKGTGAKAEYYIKCEEVEGLQT
jgi:hypothetical protein